jgi:hypothetical protein
MGTNIRQGHLMQLVWRLNLAAENVPLLFSMGEQCQKNLGDLALTNAFRNSGE